MGTEMGTQLEELSVSGKKSLTALWIKEVKSPGRYYDSNNTGLHLYVRKTGSKSWVQRLKFQGKSIDIGLGGWPKISLKDARITSLTNSKLANDGIDPRKDKIKLITIPTFSQVADDLLIKKEGELSNAKHFAQWKSTLSNYAHPSIGNKPVNEITVDDVLNTLKPIWSTKNETAKRVRGRVESVLNYAITKGYRSAPNPAIWKGNIENLLPKPSKVQNPEHMPALQLSDMQRWWGELQQRDGTGAKALMLLTLVGARSGEVRGMRHDEVEIFSEEEATTKGYLGLWRIPKARMKANVEHIIPITQLTYDLIQQTPRQNDLVFPAQKGGQLSDMTLSAVMKRMHESSKIGYIDSRNNRTAVPHGIRSTFRDWAAETKQPRDAVELQLAHRVGNKVEQAYFRTELFDIRAKVLTEWHNFLQFGM
jgi:integrase